VACPPAVDLPAIEREDWDCIIVGTGMGGAMLGYVLAQAGKRVLWCERGHSPSADAIRGSFAEAHFPRPEAPSERHREILARAGRASEMIEDRSRRKARQYIPFVGCGSGGSTALYGMALERLYPADFDPRPHCRDVPEASLPGAWPITYEELRPYYRRAEALFRVRGELDPIRVPHLDPLLAAPPMTHSSSELAQFFSGKGLHPYRLPTACEYVEGCLTCQGFLCPHECKNDAVRICLRPACERHAVLLDDCHVHRLEASRTRVTAVAGSRRGEPFRARARTVVLAAGALETPNILLRSVSADWPTGLANDSGLVGRNLMRHFVDLYAVFSRRVVADAGGHHKELAFNDLYVTEVGKLGTVQSFGPLPPVPVLVAGLEHDLRSSAAWWLLSGIAIIRPLIERYLAKRLTPATVLATIVEDLPYADNRVTPAHRGPGVALWYTIRPAETARIALMRGMMKQLLHPRDFFLVKQSENNERLAHVCGTCRFGDDPRSSVLDRHNRAHGLSNLYVVDSSWLPTSAGINPALSIAANAWRVADHMLANSLS
jgi:choline dehydrogenase-like flavoprotein